MAQPPPISSEAHGVLPPPQSSHARRARHHDAILVRSPTDFVTPPPPIKRIPAAAKTLLQFVPKSNQIKAKTLFCCKVSVFTGVRCVQWDCCYQWQWCYRRGKPCARPGAAAGVPCGAQTSAPTCDVALRVASELFSSDELIARSARVGPHRRSGVPALRSQPAGEQASAARTPRSRRHRKPRAASAVPFIHPPTSTPLNHTPRIRVECGALAGAPPPPPASTAVTPVSSAPSSSSHPSRRRAAGARRRCARRHHHGRQDSALRVFQ